MRYLALLAACAALPLAAQYYPPADTPPARPGFGVGGTIGTMGLGVDAAVRLTPQFDVRGRIAWAPWSPRMTFSDVRYDVELESPQYGLFADLYLGEQSGFRLSGGVRYAPDDLTGVAALTEPTEIGGTTYTPAEAGTLRGVVTTDAELAPYVGIGFGRVAAPDFGVFADLGVAFHGTPRIDLTSSGGSMSNSPQFQASLAAEEEAANADLDNWIVYPVLQLGFRVGF